MLMWAIVVLLIGAVVTGVWCAVIVLWPNVGYRSVLDPGRTEKCATCSIAVSVLISAFALIFVELTR